MVYLDIIRFSFLRFFSYPWEIVASVLIRVVEMLFLVLFWSLIAKDSGGLINIRQIVSYFFVSMGIRDLVMSHWGPFGGDLGNRIKTGSISPYLIRPVGIIPSIYSMAVGRNGMRVLLAIVNLVIGIAIFPPKNLISVFLFIIFFISAWWISFAYNLFQGTLYFHITDAYGVRNALNNFIRVFSGEMVPLFLFPYTLGQIVRFTPFPSMVYGPSIALSTSQINQTVILDIGIAIFWAVILNITVHLFWKRSIKNYEAVGI